MTRAGCRGVVSALLIGVGSLSLAAPLGAQVASDSVIVVSRVRILTETNAARALQDQEQSDRQQLQDWIAAQTQFLDQEEQRLTGLRPATPNNEFKQLTEEFDQKVRQVRRTAQRLDAAIQARFRDARKELLTALYPVLIDILKQEETELILDADQILIANPRIEKTEEVIALYNERVAPLVFEELAFPVLSELEDPQQSEIATE